MASYTKTPSDFSIPTNGSDVTAAWTGAYHSFLAGLNPGDDVTFNMPDGSTINFGR